MANKMLIDASHPEETRVVVVKGNRVEEFDFEEDTAGADSSKYTWANSAYAMAANINRSFKLYGWCSRIRGVESGGDGRSASSGSRSCCPGSSSASTARPLAAATSCA